MNTPKNLNDCFLIMDKELSDEIKQQLKNSSEDDILDMHFGFGMWVRNNLIYKYDIEARDLFPIEKFPYNCMHEDDMSEKIIEQYIKYLNNKEE